MSRRRREQTVSLFAFQDIITGVAGVMLFILLLLVVQLTIRTVHAATDLKPDEDASAAEGGPLEERRSFTQAQQNLEQMKQQLAELRQANAAMLDAGSVDLEERLDAAQSELAELIREAQQMKERAAAIAQQIASQSVSPERQAIIDRREELERQLESLAEERRRHASGKLVAFKTSNNSRRDMWVVDVRDVRADLFDVRDPTKVVDVSYQRESSPGAVVSAVRSKLTESTSTRSIILVLRPSVAGRGLELMEAFRSAGFNLALELLDEDTMVTRPAGQDGSGGQP